MGVIGLYDADFMNYKSVIPNLECMKLYSYLTRKKEIATLTPYLYPEKYTQFYIRKEYDDGHYPPQYFRDNCVYGGRAFNQNKYQPMSLSIEHSPANIEIYSPYLEKYGDLNFEKEDFRRIMRSCHLRVSTDSQKPDNIEALKRLVNYDKYNGLILHDYDITSIPGAFEAVQTLSNQRTYKESERIRPLPIGSKFPMKVRNLEDLKKWTSLPPMKNIFFLQLDGMITEDMMNYLVSINKIYAFRAVYDPFVGYNNEADWAIQSLSEIYKQVLFFRSHNLKILLTYDDNFIVTKELQTFIKLMNYWLTKYQRPIKNFVDGVLYFMVRTIEHDICNCQSWFLYQKYSLKLEDIRKMFLYMQKNYNQVFKMFYEWNLVEYKGGQLVNEWTGNP